MSRWLEEKCLFFKKVFSKNANSMLDVVLMLLISGISVVPLIYIANITLYYAFIYGAFTGILGSILMVVAGLLFIGPLLFALISMWRKFHREWMFAFLLLFSGYTIIDMGNGYGDYHFLFKSLMYISGALIYVVEMI